MVSEATARQNPYLDHIVIPTSSRWFLVLTSAERHQYDVIFTKSSYLIIRYPVKYFVDLCRIMDRYRYRMSINNTVNIKCWLECIRCKLIELHKHKTTVEYNNNYFNIWQRFWTAFLSKSLQVSLFPFSNLGSILVILWNLNLFLVLIECAQKT